MMLESRFNPQRMLKIATIVVLSVAIAFVPRTINIMAFSAKVIGYRGAMDALHGPVVRTTVQMAGFTTDIYKTPSSKSPLLMVHGVNPTGKDSPDLIRVSETLAQAGFEVVVPDFPEMKRQHVGAEQADAVADVFRAMDREAGMTCFSYGCGPALIAASSDIRSRVRFVVTFGGYFDMREMLEFIIVEQKGDLGYSKWQYLAANPNLSEAWPAVHHMFDSTTPVEFHRRFAEAPKEFRAALDQLSPSRYIQNLRAPLIIVHGAFDPCVPSTQSGELADAAARLHIPYGLTLFDVHGHTTMQYPPATWRNVLSIYIPESLKLFVTVSNVLSYR